MAWGWLKRICGMSGQHKTTRRESSFARQIFITVPGSVELFGDTLPVWFTNVALIQTAIDNFICVCINGLAVPGAQLLACELSVCGQTGVYQLRLQYAELFIPMDIDGGETEIEVFIAIDAPLAVATAQKANATARSGAKPSAPNTVQSVRFYDAKSTSAWQKYVWVDPVKLKKALPRADERQIADNMKLVARAQLHISIPEFAVGHGNHIVVRNSNADSKSGFPVVEILAYFIVNDLPLEIERCMPSTVIYRQNIGPVGV